MENIKESATAQEYILKYAIVEQLQQLEEDSKITTMPKPSKYSEMEKAMLWVSASKYKRNKAILN